MMSARYIFCVMLLWPISGFSQIGTHFKYVIGQSDQMDAYRLSQDGVYLAVEFGFRFKPRRIEFHPALGYRRTFYNDTQDPFATGAKHGYMDALDFDFHTDLDLFDFEGDCDCPTWSKEGEFFKKGFFLEVSPGLSFQGLTRTFYYSDPGSPDVPVTSTNLLWKFSLGAGIDIGISEHITITPILSWTMLSKAEWAGLDENGEAGTLDDQTYLAAGFRTTYIMDPKRRGRY